ncbi:STAS-like domain-containing protein [Actinobacillus equuli subsp. haemolyticus]|uniref:STAS-like domain-containing protein n=1 Tax=Actinobacillus equuli subsp. equuli TaxID=202947 RepID=A0A9X4G2E1_ACTEU|nr:STAS-like domain-containing protein [Actinobacillus equuli]MDE8034629.1 STAS-like domain-containing protein [Actinobacillus equuli subsp. equuli]MDG4948735.1 STAS-like domain-containing protein [Actinobacillus equuli subsp. haemolyticus]WGE63774.1 STAS-like domain-containing protein [Actinobacillus equuli subsp. haemolyticus]
MPNLVIVDEFSKSPYGRYKSTLLPTEEDTSGETFRETLLAPKLREAIKNNDILNVVLTGYNRYARSFLDEAFGGLIRECGFTYEQILKHLSYEHATIPSIPAVIKERIEKAAIAKGFKNED